MTRQETTEELSLLCRSHRLVALGTIGYLTALMDEEELEQARQFAHELAKELIDDGHIQALVRERYGYAERPARGE